MITRPRASWLTRLVSLGLVGLMLTGVIGVGAASADHMLLYPFWISNAPNVTTFISYMNPFFNGDPGDPADFLHYQYFFKLASASESANCEAYSTFGRTSENDVVTFDVAGLVSTEPLLFDTTSASAGGLGLSMTIKNTIGYLLIINRSGEGPTYGEALIADIANGGIWGYLADSIPEDDDAANGLRDSHVLATGTRRPVQLLPTNAATTDFLVTPLGTDMAVNSSSRTALQMQQTAGFGPDFAVPGPVPPGGVYDRNENPLDFQRRPNVRCVAILTYSDLISSSVLANPVWARQGGWAWLANVVLNDDPESPAFDRNAVVFKRTRSSVFGSFAVDAQRVIRWSESNPLQ